MTSNKKNVLKLLLIIVFLTACNCKILFAQDFKISGYADTYYAYDNDKNGMSLRQFSAIAPIRDQFRMNFAEISGKYNAEKIRGIVSLQFGDIPKYNWPQAPNEYLQYIQEANAGFKPSKNLWVDFGYFLTHIGAEGIIPKNNYLSSLALTTYYEPFFQSGIKVSYDFSDKLYGSLYLLNGYNVFADNNKNKSGGVQFGVKPAANLELIYNNIFGNEQPEGTKGKTRIYNNLVIKWSALKKLDILLGGDFCIQENSKLSDSTSSANMFAGLLSFRYNPVPKFYLSARGEIFTDEDGIISGTYSNSNGQLAGLKASGLTFGVEYRPVDNGYVRIETRYLKTGNDLKIFSDGKNPRNFRSEYIFTTGVEF